MAAIVMRQNTFVILKPEAIDRGLVGKIISRFEVAGLEITAMQMMNGGKLRWAEHYAQHVGQPWLDDVIKKLSNRAVLVLSLVGEDAIGRVRRMAGGSFMTPGTIRGDFAESFHSNCIHTAENEDAVEREKAIWFAN